MWCLFSEQRGGGVEAADLDLWPLLPRLPMMNKAMIRPMLADDVVRFIGESIDGRGGSCSRAQLGCWRRRA